MERANLPEGGRKHSSVRLGDPGYLGEAPILFDRRANPREIEEIPGLDMCCAYADTEICGRCGAC